MSRTLIRGATVIASPPDAPMPGATDILIQDGTIVAIGPDLSATDAETVDGAGRIVIPGLVNAHMHTWQTALRGVTYDWTLLEYVGWMHAQAAAQFAPEDIGVSTLAGALNQINCGTTTLGDWCHNLPTPAHADAAVGALREAGIRAVFFHGTPPTRDLATHRAALERLLASDAFAPGGLLTLGLAITGPQFSPPGVAEADLALAASLDLTCSLHHSGGAPMTELWDHLLASGMMGPQVNIVHANTMADDLMARLVAAGVSFTITPEVELNDGHGHPITGRLRALGAAPSIGIDIESGTSGEMLIAARIALAHQRALDFDRDPLRPGGTRPDDRLRGSHALAWATIEGARALRLEDRIGSLAPGKQADLVMIDARPLNIAPVHDPVAAVLQATLANIEAVMIGGQWRKRDGRLLADVSDLQRRLADCGTRIAARAPRLPG